MYYPAIPLWSILLIAAVAYAVGKYLHWLEDKGRGDTFWTPVFGGIFKLIGLTFAVIGLIRAIAILRR